MDLAERRWDDDLIFWIHKLQWEFSMTAKNQEASLFG
jgi:hypothetical protein